MLLALAAYLRHFAFFLPSNVGDSTAYQSLAMKMNHGFMTNYDIFKYRMVPRAERGLADYVWENDPRLWQANRIRKIYHQPLHLQPPLYPILIWLSHGLFQHGEPYTSVGQNLGSSVMKHPPWNFAKAHFYAIVIPFLCSLGTLLLVYLFCLRFFSFREGLIAVALLATSPIDIAVSPKLFADGILTFLSFLSLHGYFKSLEIRRGSSWLALASGAALGLAYLTKVSGILFAVGILLATLLHPRFRGKERLGAPQLWLAGFGAFFVALPWLGLMFRHYGTVSVNSPPDASNPWYQYVFSRPFKAYIQDLFWFVPPFVLGALAGAFAWLKPQRRWVAASLFGVSAFYLFMFYVFLKTGSAGVEDRYLLPIYPPLAILTAWGAAGLARRFAHGWARALYWMALSGGLIYWGWNSLQYGLEQSFAALVIFRPLGF